MCSIIIPLILSFAIFRYFEDFHFDVLSVGAHFYAVAYDLEEN
jgi:hypothetical protein